MAAPIEDYSSSDEGLPIGDIPQPTQHQIEEEMLDDWMETFPHPRDAAAKMLGDIGRIKGEFDRYAAVSNNVSPMMAHFAQETAELAAKIKEREAQLDIASRVAFDYKCQEQDCDSYMCVICCEFFNCDDDICPSGEAISQIFKAAPCGHDVEDFEDDTVCFGCRPFTGWVTEDAVDADGDPAGVEMAFCSEKCKQMSKELRNCEDDLLQGWSYKHHTLTPDEFEATKEAHAVVYAYQCRHLTTEPYNYFPVEVVPAWEEYAKHVKILNMNEPAEGEY